MAKQKTEKEEKQKISSSTHTFAKSDDGTIQITFTIPFSFIDENRKKVAESLSKDIEVPGFRKGKAPLDKAIERIPQNTLLERTLGNILPRLVGEVIEKEKLKIAMYPKFELIKADEGEDWQVRAITAELPEFELGDYKKEISGKGRADAIWTPDKGKPEAKKEKSREEKEQEVIKTLLNLVKINIAKVLIDEEVNSRLSQLLERIEKLGLNLDSYLASIGKSPDILRKEYEEQSKNTIALDLILNKIADKEGLTVDKQQIDAAIQASAADPELAKELDTPERRRMIEAILRKRIALDNLTNLLS
jgi:FKBP-type peptidyl-prolyl cis-trans isomerase (trigger factor)